METVQAGQVDELLDANLPEDDVLQQIRQDSHAAGLPTIEVSVQQGRLLNLLASIAGAQHILEVGTLGGYSTVCLARALPDDGSMITLEYELDHAAVAKKNLELAEVSHKVSILVGPAAKTLPALQDRIKYRVMQPFDFVFIDADKESNQEYTQWAIALTQPGATIVIDNVIRDGRVLTVADKQEYIEYLGANPRIQVSVIQTVGDKGWDGFVVCRRV